MTLQEFFQCHPSGALAFSGGTKSSLLVWAAKQYGQDWHAYYVNTAFQPDFELADARKIASECGLPLTRIDGDILKCRDVVENSSDRCYFCKRAIFSMIRHQAELDGFSLLIDGTDASDNVPPSPEKKALEEFGIRSPLQECGLTKWDIRDLSRQADLFTWNKPAYSCLATRIPFGTPLTADALRRVEQGENLLYSLGFTNFRICLHGSAAILQLPQELFSYAIQRREAILERLKPLFPLVAIDLLPSRKSTAASEITDPYQ